MKADQTAKKIEEEELKGSEKTKKAAQPAGLRVSRIALRNLGCRIEEDCYERMDPVGVGTFRYFF